jgi:hypothetical protein
MERSRVVWTVESGWAVTDILTQLLIPQQGVAGRIRRTDIAREQIVEEVPRLFEIECRFD